MMVAAQNSEIGIFGRSPHDYLADRENKPLMTESPGTFQLKRIVFTTLPVYRTHDDIDTAQNRHNVSELHALQQVR